MDWGVELNKAGEVLPTCRGLGKGESLWLEPDPTTSFFIFTNEELRLSVRMDVPGQHGT